MKWKIHALDFAELLDAYRVFVRAIMVAYAAGYFYLVIAIWDWFKNIPDPIATQTAFATGLLSIVGGLLTVLTNTYVKTGRHWQ